MQTENHEENVVSLFDRQKPSSRPEANKANSAATNEESFDFETVMRRNAENKQRLSKERKKSNKGVIRSYRLKH